MHGEIYFSRAQMLLFACSIMFIIHQFWLLHLHNLMATSTKNATDISPVSSFSNYSPKSYISPAPATSAKSYVVYSSHSGFNNQRSSLENAIRIALRLNATLVLPFAQLGTMAFPWKPFDKLFGQGLSTNQLQ